MNREYLKWRSAYLDRDMEFLWYGYSGRPLILFPTSMGRFFENEDFHLVQSLGPKIEAGELQVICVDSIDEESWYNKFVHPAVRVRRHEQYDLYLRQELVPYIHHRAGRIDLAVYGASFGAYHASNFAARHPEVVSRTIVFSGIYDIHRFLDGYWDDACYYNCPTAFIPNMSDESSQRLAHVEWVVATGEHDSLVQENRHFAGMLHSKGQRVHSEFWPGVFGHDWPYWRDNLHRFV